MTERDQVVEILRKAISPPFKAVMGDGAGIVVVDGRPGYVWCRKLGKTEMLMQAYNRGAPAIEDVIVLIQESRIEGVKGYEVIGVASSTSPDNYYPEVPPHAWTHEWRPGIGRDRVTVYPRAWGYLRAEPIATGSMNVWVTPGWYYYNDYLRWYVGGYSPAFYPPPSGTWYQLLSFEPLDETLHITNGPVGGYGLLNEIPSPSGCTYPIAAIESTGTFAAVTENMIEDVRLFMDPIEDCGEIGTADSVLIRLTNRTGEQRVVGDVVVTDPNYDESFTGTLVQGYAGKVLVVAETIESLIAGTLWERGGPFDVETEGIIARNDGLRTSGTLFLAEATSSPTGTGVFAIAVSSSAGDGGTVKALFLDELAAPGGDGGVTTIEIQEDDVKVTDANTVNFEGGGGKVVDEGGGKVTVDITPGAGAGLYSDYIHIRDEKAANTAGGTFTSGAWRTRDLNIELSDTGGDAALASNQITLEAGTYRCLISCPAYGVLRHKARLQNITDATTIIVGTSEFAYSGVGEPAAVYNRSFVVGRFTLAAQKVLEVQHRSQGTVANNGLGVESNFGVVEVYTEVELWKEA